MSTKSHSSFLLNWFNSSCMAIIHPSYDKASLTKVGYIMDISPNIEFSSLNADLFLRVISLFTMTNSSGWEDLYLKVFIDCAASWESQRASSKLASYGCVSGVRFGFVPLPSEHLTSKTLASDHLSSKGIIAFDPPTSG